MAIILDPTEVARNFRKEIREHVQALGHPIKLVGLLAHESGPSVTYASYTQAACEDVGIGFELRRKERLSLESEIESLNGDDSIHGVIVYYPIFFNEQDNYLKDLVSPQKDIEGLGSFWIRRLYRNERIVDGNQNEKSILPCTPLAVVKLLEAAGCLNSSNNQKPLAGKTVTVFNRSEVVGRPLASMLAHDGASVYSFDLLGPLEFNASGVFESTLTREEALARSDIVVTGVPHREFPLVKCSEIRPQCVCLNFSTYKNFVDDIVTKASVFVPRVGPMTVTMALRNTLRLYNNYHIKKNYPK